MTLHEYLKQEGRGAFARLFAATLVSPTVLRKIARNQPVRRDIAQRVADFLGGKVDDIPTIDPPVMPAKKARRRRT